MASANVVFGKVSGGLPVFDSTFASVAVASGAESRASAAGETHIRVTPITAAQYFAFGTAPDATIDPRVLVPLGASFEVSAPVGTKVEVLDA